MIEFEVSDSLSSELSVRPGAHRPIESTAVQRVSRFFSVSFKSYSGYWHWRPLDFAEPQPGPSRMVERTNHFFDRWVSDFGRNPVAVENLKQIASQTEPLRKIQIGIKMGETPWGGVVLFDGSTRMFNFHSMGKMVENSFETSSRSDLELRYPDLKLPERRLEERGEEVQIFFLGQLTSLHEIQKAIPYLYHRVALMLLMKTNPELVQTRVPENKLKDDPQLENQLQMHKHFSTSWMTPINVAEAAYLKAFIPQEKWPEAVFNARNVRMYGSTHVDLLPFYEKQGWKVLETQPRDGVDPDIRILYFEVANFIGRYFWSQETRDILAKATKVGEDSEAYKAEREKEMERFRKYWYQFKENRRSFAE
ncbi:MAG: hypothetical protein KDD33_06005 [Bdellovibrionales bacterium]|nr:hypothetical protein [Bdellovibrionales bacterium]